MSVTYASPHHSADDPGGLIGQALDMGAEFPGLAEDLLLAWSLRLAPGTEPAGAADRLLAARGLGSGPLSAGAGGRLVELLRAAAIGDLPTQPRRRGGRRARVEG